MGKDRSHLPQHPSVEEYIDQYSFLQPGEEKDRFQPTIELNTEHKRLPNRPEEVIFQRLMKVLGINWEYEPFLFRIEDREGIPRGFAPDFFIPGFGVIIEMCKKNVWEKNKKVRLTAEHWPTLPVLVLKNHQIEELYHQAVVGDLTSEGLRAFIDEALVKQAKRIEEQGDLSNKYLSRA